ncbi:DUF3299 domain-containing protein [Tropicimonas aquimaris]|uniref:DUF3299 domain-containing protein n=1 Tax=Tropicimonas aquimaris TaxID=914152 RepID=A0ABW3ITR1_9RHOB
MPALTRRALCALLAAACATTGTRLAWASEVLDLDWEDLIPESDGKVKSAYEALGVISHDQISQAPADSGFAPVRSDLDGKVVRIPGYVVPLDYGSEGVTTFLLVPYVGACIHVPPPPSNQLILVNSEVPQEFGGLFEPVIVTGMLGTSASETELADVGYVITADQVAPYGL